MIIIGYPGVGKSWYCKEHNDGIDLESSIIDKSSPDWADKYVVAAKALSDLGYKVFISSHGKVQESVKRYGSGCNSDNTVAIYPSKNIKDKWIEKLKTRSKESGLDKDKRAYERALSHFDEDIEALENIFNCNRAIIETTDFHLEDIDWDTTPNFRVVWYPESYDVEE